MPRRSSAVLRSSCSSVFLRASLPDSLLTTFSCSSNGFGYLRTVRFSQLFRAGEMRLGLLLAGGGRLIRRPGWIVLGDLIQHTKVTLLRKVCAERICCFH